jgi:hypothetical protein
MVLTVRILVICAISLILLSAVTLAAKPRIELCDNTPLPEEIRKLLAQKFPAWRTLQLSDLHPEKQQLWLDGEHRNECPGITVGHFEATTRLSYAVVLIPRDTDKITFKVVVVGDGKQRPFKLTMLEEPEYIVNYNVIYRVAPGKYSDVGQTQSVQLSLDGLMMRQLDVGTTLFYWKDGHYRRLIISD